jgi:lipopolysaccharide export system permease protein
VAQEPGVNIIDRYIARTVLAYTLMVTAVLITLASLFTFIGQQDDIGTGTYDVGNAFLYTALTLPQQLYESLPIAALIGGILGLGNLARDSELTVMRAAGVSVARLGASAALAGVVLLAAMWVLGEYVAPPADQYARQLKIFSKFSEYNAAGNSSSWVKDGNRIINIQQQTADNIFGGVFVFDLAPDHSVEAVGRADTATHESGRTWRFGNLAETRFTDAGTRVERSAARELEVSISQDFLGLAVVSPASLPVRALYRYVGHLRANNLESGAYEIALWSRVSRTVAILLVCVLAVPFAFGPLRSSGAGARTVAGILTGVLFFLVNRTLENSGQVYGLSPLLAAWAPTALLAMVTAAAIWRVR